MSSESLHRFVVLLVVFGAGVLIGVGVAQTPSSLDRAAVPEGTVSVMLDLGDGRIETVTNVPWQEGQTVFDVLTAAADEKGFIIESRDFGGDLGMFIETIAGVGKDPEGTRWWQFWVNNVYSMVGVSFSKTQPNDVIAFKFTGQRPEE